MNETKTLAMRLLAIRSYFVCELEAKLREKECPPDEIAQVIEECKSFGYLNDEEHLKAFIRSSLNKKMSARAIAMKLQRKGLDREFIQEAMESLKGDGRQKENIVKLLETRYQDRNLSDFREKQKVIASLMRKGYNLQDIRDALSNF